jgi:hypothetical protein
MQAGIQYEEPALMDMGQFQQRQKLAQAEAEARLAEQRQEQKNWQAKFNQDAEQFRLKQEADAAAAGVAKPADIMSVVREYGDQPGVKGYGNTSTILQSLRKSIDDPPAVADLDFISGVSKVLDPNSIVHVSEGQAVVDSQSIPQRLLGYLNKFASGKQTINPQVRRELYTLARRRVSELHDQAQRERQHYLGLGRSWGVGEQHIRPLDPLAEEAPPMPVVPPPAPGGAAVAPAPAQAAPVQAAPPRLQGKASNGVPWSLR